MYLLIIIYGEIFRAQNSKKVHFSQLEKSDERIIALEAQVKIVNIEKKRVEEECQKLRDENGLFRDRLQEVAKARV